MRVLGVNNAKAEAQWQELPVPKVAKGEIRIQVEALVLTGRTFFRLKVCIRDQWRYRRLDSSVPESLIRLVRALTRPGWDARYVHYFVVERSPNMSCAHHQWSYRRLKV